MLNENERQELKEKISTSLTTGSKSFVLMEAIIRSNMPFAVMEGIFVSVLQKKVSVLRPTGNTPSGAMSVGCITIWRQ